MFGLEWKLGYIFVIVLPIALACVQLHVGLFNETLPEFLVVSATAR
jgi:hypothetical protein